MGVKWVLCSMQFLNLLKFSAARKPTNTNIIQTCCYLSKPSYHINLNLSKEVNKHRKAPWSILPLTSLTQTAALPVIYAIDPPRAESFLCDREQTAQPPSLCVNRVDFISWDPRPPRLLKNCQHDACQLLAIVKPRASNTVLITYLHLLIRWVNLPLQQNKKE